MGQIVSRIEQHHRVTAGILKNCLFNVFLLALSWFPQKKKKERSQIDYFWVITKYTKTYLETNSSQIDASYDKLHRQ